MRHQSLRFTANLLYILTWVILVIGVAVSVLLGVFGSTLVSKAIFLLGGLVFTGVSVLMLFAISRLINLFIEIEEDLKQLTDNLKKE
jgi:hypothetical protein